MKPWRLSIAQAACRHLPPLIGQQVRGLIYPQGAAFADNYTFLTTAQTGSPFSSTTGGLHGYPFAVHGYFNWRAWAIALAVCSPGDTILEIGANVGTETVGFADIVGCSGRVFAFEPLPSNHQALTETLKLHRCNNVTVLSYALSDQNGTVHFKVPEGNQSSGVGHILSDAASQQPGTIEVECHTLDFMSELVGHASLIFMDTEGAEYHILQGGRSYLEEHRPVIILEAGHRQLAQHGLKLQDLYDEIGRSDYAVFAITRFGLRPVTPKVFGASAMDWLCVPAARQIHLIPRIKRRLWSCGWMPCIPFLNPMTRKA